jgi:hypothetical protein
MLNDVEHVAYVTMDPYVSGSGTPTSLNGTVADGEIDDPHNVALGLLIEAGVRIISSAEVHSTVSSSGVSSSGNLSSTLSVVAVFMRLLSFETAGARTSTTLYN